MNFTNQMAEYLLSQRWCSFKEKIRLGQITELNLQSVPFDNGKKLFCIGQVKENADDTRYFVMPLQEVSKDEKPTFEINGKHYRDALQEKDYWQKLMALFEHNNGEIHFPNGWVLKTK